MLVNGTLTPKIASKLIFIAEKMLHKPAFIYGQEINQSRTLNFIYKSFYFINRHDHKLNDKCFFSH